MRKNPQLRSKVMITGCITVASQTSQSFPDPQKGKFVNSKSLKKLFVFGFIRPETFKDYMEDGKSKGLN